MRLFLLAALLVAVGAVASWWPVNYERMQRATVLIEMRYDGVTAMQASGFLTAEGVVTAAHFVEDMPEGFDLAVRFHDGTTVRASVERIADESDLAILSIPKNARDTAPVSCVAASVGDTVYASGSPMIFRWVVARGVITSDTPDQSTRKGEHLYTDAAIWSGMSGGPVFNRYGYVVGVSESALTAGVGGASGHARIVSGPALCDFLG